MHVVAVATFYRTSGLRTKERKTLFPKMKSFPAHHEVRFGQHLVQLCEAVLTTLIAVVSIGRKLLIPIPGTRVTVRKRRRKRKDSSKPSFLQAFKYGLLLSWLTSAPSSGISRKSVKKNTSFSLIFLDTKT